MTNVDIHIDADNTSSASNVYHNALVRSEIIECIHHQHEQADVFSFALTSKEAYQSALRYLRRKVTFSQVIEASKRDRYAQYLESVHALVVQEHSVRLVDGQLLVGGKKQSADADIVLSLVRSYPYKTPHVFHLKGIRYMPNLRWISIECCPSDLLDPKLNLKPSIRVRVERKEIYQVGPRRIEVTSRAKGQIRRWDWETLWDPQAMQLKDDPSSAFQRWSKQAVLDTITIWPSERAAIEEEEDTDDDFGVDPVIQSLRHWKMDTRLSRLRDLYIKDQDICAETLQMILRQCPMLEQIEVSLSSDSREAEDYGLLQDLTGRWSLIDVTLRGNAKIEWLPFLRRCKRVSLLSLREVDGERFSPPSVLRCWNVSEWEDLYNEYNLDLDRVYLEDLTIDLPISGVRTCLQADTLIRFIKTNTTDQTRVHLNVAGSKVDFDVKGVTDEDDDDGSGRDVEMIRAHRAILRYAAQEREKLDRVVS
ncbi:hypothetical protein FFLO_05747 [Filobasidium floriforme]|uniref:Uncharacterized protein n=1 Tax=Filobasidium floriforme TaxID=5210 RepID=A0A8K0JI01_9TREE|nr:hypothetical protein FFLO_05747 [Filobasidium floriforme]